MIKIKTVYLFQNIEGRYILCFASQPSLSVTPCLVSPAVVVAPPVNINTVTLSLRPPPGQLTLLTQNTELGEVCHHSLVTLDTAGYGGQRQTTNQSWLRFWKM